MWNGTVVTEVLTRCENILNEEEEVDSSRLSHTQLAGVWTWTRTDRIENKLKLSQSQQSQYSTVALSHLYFPTCECDNSLRSNRGWTKNGVKFIVSIIQFQSASVGLYNIYKYTIYSIYSSADTRTETKMTFIIRLSNAFETVWWCQWFMVSSWAAQWYYAYNIHRRSVIMIILLSISLEFCRFEALLHAEHGQFSK